MPTKKLNTHELEDIDVASSSHEKDAPASIRIKLKYSDVAAFVERFAVNVGRAGFFLPTKSPKPVGTPVRFELLLEDGTTRVLRGEGVVVSARAPDPAKPNRPSGMGIKYSRLDSASRAMVDRVTAVKKSRGLRDDSAVPMPIASSSESGPIVSVDSSDHPCSAGGTATESTGSDKARELVVAARSPARSPARRSVAARIGRAAEARSAADKSDEDLDALLKLDGSALETAIRRARAIAKEAGGGDELARLLERDDRELPSLEEATRVLANLVKSSTEAASSSAASTSILKESAIPAEAEQSAGRPAEHQAPTAAEDASSKPESASPPAAITEEGSSRPSPTATAVEQRQTVPADGGEPSRPSSPATSSSEQKDLQEKAPQDFTPEALDRPREPACAVCSPPPLPTEIARSSQPASPAPTTENKREAQASDNGAAGEGSEDKDRTDPFGLAAMIDGEVGAQENPVAETGIVEPGTLEMISACLEVGPKDSELSSFALEIVEGPQANVRRQRDARRKGAGTEDSDETSQPVDTSVASEEASLAPPASPEVASALDDGLEVSIVMEDDDDLLISVEPGDVSEESGAGFENGRSAEPATETSPSAEQGPPVEPEPDPEAEPESEPEPEPNLSIEPGIESESESGAGSGSETGADRGQESGPENGSKPASAAEPEPRSSIPTPTLLGNAPPEPPEPTALDKAPAEDRTPSAAADTEPPEPTPPPRATPKKGLFRKLFGR
ncbi:MAG: hypothetical protein V2A73_05895 [Pseudomonadota bacterium]